MLNPKKRPGKAAHAKQVARVKLAAHGAGLIQVALQSAAERCSDAGVAALLRAVAESGTDRGVQTLDGEQSGGREEKW